MGLDETLRPGSRWHQMLPFLQDLPDGNLERKHLLKAPFLIGLEEPNVSVYWVPFERLNPDARLTIVGLTPGWVQMQAAFMSARDALKEGRNTRDTLLHVAQQAGFKGPMRKNLISMLDHIGLPAALSIDSSADLFGDANHLVHITSALRYPVFVGGGNYGGTGPAVSDSPLLNRYIDKLLAVPNSLILPLGKATESCLRILIRKGVLPRNRCLFGFPHPSGGNGHRLKHFRENEEALREAVSHWATGVVSSHPECARVQQTL